MENFVSAVFLAIVGALIWFPDLRATIWRWLKGSRTTYYFPRKADGHPPLAFTASNIRKDHHRYLHTDGEAIEINRGFWRRRSRVHSFYYTGWKIAKVYHGDDLKDIRVVLNNRNTLSVERALRLVNDYGSLDQMLRRIEKLEGELATVRLQAQVGSDLWWASIKAILKIIEDDKNRYRSSAAGRIRECLEYIDHQATEQGCQPPSDALVIMTKGTMQALMSTFDSMQKS